MDVSSVSFYHHGFLLCHYTSILYNTGIRPESAMRSMPVQSGTCNRFVKISWRLNPVTRLWNNKRTDLTELVMGHSYARAFPILTPCAYDQQSYFFHINRSTLTDTPVQKSGIYSFLYFFRAHKPRDVAIQHPKYYISRIDEQKFVGLYTEKSEEYIACIFYTRTRSYI